ncbi:FAA hydrolase family protein [Ramlibacter sp. WS9]|nr:FAA hydrolase family protein [Ramlibacter sp. WS9]
MMFNLAPSFIPLTGEDRRFPVRRIYCVGRNYLDHIREMGGDEREPPFFFQKPADALVLDGACVPYPSATEDFQHEVELVLAIGTRGRNIETGDAARFVCAVGVGIDLTRRDLQLKARDRGRPWEPGKSFDHSAVCSELLPWAAPHLPEHGLIELSVNDEVRQTADLGQLIWSCAEIVSQLSRQYLLMPGDLIYTGTPAGVGALRPGDQVVAEAQQIGSVRISIGEPAAG